MTGPNSLVRFALSVGGDDMHVMLPNLYLNGRYSACNPTCTYFGGRLLVNSRLVNYKKILQSETANFINDAKNQTYYLNEDGFDSRNVMFEMDADGLPKGIREVDYGDGYPDVFYRGFEDCRFVVWDGMLYAYGTRWDRIPGKGVICIYRLDENFDVCDEIVVNSPTGSVCEKNWCAIADMPFCFIYKANETTVIRVYEDGSSELLVANGFDERYPGLIKGSTPVVRYGDNGYVGLVHKTEYVYENGIEKSTYLTAFIFYDNRFGIERMSKWFVFRTELCEFACGLCIHGGDMYISYSQIDCTAHVLRIPSCSIEAFMASGTWPEYGHDYICGLARKYERAEQHFTSSVLYNYAATMIRQPNELKLECVVKAFLGLVQELDVVKSGNHSERLIHCIGKSIEEFGDVPDLKILLNMTLRFSGQSDMVRPLSEYEKHNLKYVSGLINADYW